MSENITNNPSVPSQIVGEVTFPKFISNLGIIPTAYKDSMDYYENLAWLCKFLEETVIPTVNQNGEAVEELQGLYVELNSYVTHYFDNLDVQEEINNKLDEMSQDGTLTVLIKNYVDPIYEAFEEQIIDEIMLQNTNISNFKNNVNYQISQQNALITSVTSGNPLSASSTSEMTDTSKIYVNTTDGKWYYYNNSQWNIGGTYISSDLSNDEKLKIENLDKLRKIDKCEVITNYYNKLITNTGELGNDSNIRIASDLLEIPVDSYLSIKLLEDDTRMGVYFYDNNKNYISNLNYFEDTIVPYNSKYYRLYFGFIDNTQISASDWASYFEIGLVNKETTVKKEIKNILDLTNLTEGYISSANGAINSSATNYLTSDFIPVSYGQKITFSPRIRKFLAYEYPELPITNSYEGDTINHNFTYTATKNCLVRISFALADKYLIHANYGDTANSYIKNGEVQENLINEGNVLSGKTLVACGDSFTVYTDVQGGDGSHTDENWSDKYNCLKTYPYWIAKRNNMNLKILGKNGMTMCYNSSVGSNSFSYNNYYQNIPNGADYILLKFGINDDATHQHSPVGTIDDNDNTTLYGAWNIVMDYILQNHPESKVGILATNGSTSEIVNVAINIAKKWGVAYLNEGLGEDMTAFFRTARTDVSQTVKDTLLSRYSVNQAQGDTHPDVIWHEKESHIVEQFLRSLI